MNGLEKDHVRYLLVYGKAFYLENENENEKVGDVISGSQGLESDATALHHDLESAGGDEGSVGVKPIFSGLAGFDFALGPPVSGLDTSASRD